MYVSNIAGVFMKSQMDVAIKIEIDDREHDKHRSNLAIEKHCYDDMGVQRKCHFSPISNKTDATILTDPIDFNSSLVGVPQIIYFGDNEHDQEKIMVMEMLGLNLDKMFIQSKLNFSLERIHWIAKQLVSVEYHRVYCQIYTNSILRLCQIDRMQTVHEAGWVYVDIKPENFAVGKYDSWLIYIFGKNEDNRENA